MSYRDTATAIAQRAPGNFIGVVLYVSAVGKAPFWSASALTNAAVLQDWYEELSPSAQLFYYIAAFDKTQGLEPVGEAIAPIKPGMPRLVIVDEYPRVQASISGDDRSLGSLAKTIGLFALFAIPVGIILTKTQEKKQLREEKAAFRRIGLDWNQRVCH